MIPGLSIWLDVVKRDVEDVGCHVVRGNHLVRRSRHDTILLLHYRNHSPLMGSQLARGVIDHPIHCVRLPSHLDEWWLRSRIIDQHLAFRKATLKLRLSLEHCIDTVLNVTHLEQFRELLIGGSLRLMLVAFAVLTVTRTRKTAHVP